MSKQRKMKREKIPNARIEPAICKLTDRGAFYVDRETYGVFLARLDAPPDPNVRLVRTLSTTPPWKR